MVLPRLIGLAPTDKPSTRFLHVKPLYSFSTENDRALRHQPPPSAGTQHVQHHHAACTHAMLHHILSREPWFFGAFPVTSQGPPRDRETGSTQRISIFLRTGIPRFDPREEKARPSTSVIGKHTTAPPAAEDHASVCARSFWCTVPLFYNCRSHFMASRKASCGTGGFSCICS